MLSRGLVTSRLAVSSDLVFCSHVETGGALELDLVQTGGVLVGVIREVELDE